MTNSSAGRIAPQISKHPTYNLNVVSSSVIWFFTPIICGTGPYFAKGARTDAESKRQTIGNTRDRFSTSDPNGPRRLAARQNGQIIGMAVRATAAQTRSSGIPTRRKSRKR